MGTGMSSILTSKAGEDEKLANDALNSLVTIAKMRQEVFLLKVKNSKNSKVDSTDIPINKILSKLEMFKCSVDLESDTLGTEIGKIIGNFASGEILNGITNLAKDALNLVFGNFSSNQSEHSISVISVGNAMGIVRIDADFFAYQYNSKDLGAICKNVVASSIVVSSVDTSELDAMTLRSIVQVVYGSLTKEEMKQIFDELREALKEDENSLHSARMSNRAPPYPNPETAMMF